MLDQRTRTDRERTADPSPSSRDDAPLSRPRVAELADEARSANSPLTAAALFVAGAAVAVATAVLIVQNTESATIEFLGWDPTGPMWIVLVLTFAAGLLMGPLLAAGVALARTRRRHRVERIDELAGSARRS